MIEAELVSFSPLLLYLPKTSLSRSEIDRNPCYRNGESRASMHTALDPLKQFQGDGLCYPGMSTRKKGGLRHLEESAEQAHGIKKQST